MLKELIAPWCILPPAIWGKLPDHADFVRSGVRHGEAEAWMLWLAQQGFDAKSGAAARSMSTPVAFVLPAGVLAFARRRFVFGVMAPSIDKVGRSHPLVIYQQAHPRWAMRHFEAQLEQPRNWQFWVARAMARHARTQDHAGFPSLEGAVRALWEESRKAEKNRLAQRTRRMEALLHRWLGPPPENDPAAKLHGVRHLPWADWPHRLQGAHAESAFWQQDAEGRFIGAANRLHKLWGGVP